MNIRKGKLLSFILCISIVLAFSTVDMAFADSSYDDVVKWDCGEGVYAEYSDGALTIRPDGEGIMWDFDSMEHPWKEYTQYIDRAYVYGELKHLGNEALADLTELHKVYFRKSIEEVGKDIFKNCPALEEINMVVETREEADYIWSEQAKDKNFDNKIWKTWHSLCESLGDAKVYRFFTDEESLRAKEGYTYPLVQEGTDEPNGTDNGSSTSTKTSKSITYSNQLINRDTWELISLSDFKGIKKSAVYTGKKIKFNITSDKLEENVDYKVKYKNNRKLGEAEIIIEGIGNYGGEIRTSFKIKPRGTSIKSVKAYKKYIKVTWKKQPKNISGYEIQYSTDPSFKDPNIHLVKKRNSTSTKISCRIKSGKKYYVRIRTYKADGMIITDHSKWSKVKKVKAK